MLATHLDAETRYTQKRLSALEIAAKRVPPELEVEFRLIDELALSAARQWRLSPHRKVDWDWKGGYRDFSYRYPKRFELAIWQHDVLLNLAMGRPTFHGGSLRLDFIEAKPDDRNVQVFPLILVALLSYAGIIGAKEIRLVQPINDYVRQHYEKWGFKYIAKGDYLYLTNEV